MKTPALAFVLLAFVATVRMAAADRDPIEGKWYGMAGHATDRVEIGYEFKRNEHDELRAYLFQPVTNFYGQDFSAVRAEGDGRYTLPDIATTLTLTDGKLTGSYFPSRMPIELARVETLPAEQPIPDFPTGPGPKWRVRLGGQIYAPVAVRDGVAYVGTTSGVFNAINITDGTFAWAFASGRPIHGEALVTDDAVFFTCDNGYLFKLNRANGTEIWRYDLGGERVPRVLMHQKVFEWDYRSPKPVLADGVIYVGSADGSFHALRSENAERLWRIETKGRIRSDALVHGDIVLFGNHAGQILAVARSDGNVRWKKEIPGASMNAAPALVGDRIVMASRGGLIFALNPVDGARLWLAQIWGSAAESPAAPFEDHFYIGASDLRRVTRYDPRDGRVVWRTDIYGIAWAKPAVTETTVYAAAGGFDPYQMRHHGGLCALDRQTGAVRWRWPAPRDESHFENGFAAGATLAGDTLVIGGMDGTLYAFPVEDTLAR